MIVVDTPSVGGNILSPMELTVTISMTILVGIFLNDSLFHVEQTISLTVQIHSYISGTFQYLETMFSSIFSTLVGLFDRVGLRNNVRKTVGMVCRPCQATGT